jgi:uncharacterized membrane protein YdjX (TVP38/TMEM64 family)
VVILVLVALMTIYHDPIIKWFEPIAEKIRDIPAGWTIFVGILFVISFPPLFGQEIVALLCGMIYGLWIGFAIVSLGSFLGEVGCVASSLLAPDNADGLPQQLLRLQMVVLCPSGEA